MNSPKRIYLPNEETNDLLCIAFTSSGLIIPLGDMGYPGLHLTIYLREREDDSFKFSIHLTEDSTKKILNEQYRIITEEHLKEFGKKIELMIPEMIRILEETLFVKGSQPKHLACQECIAKDHFQIENLGTRKKAENLYSSLPQKEDEVRMNIMKYVGCANPEHKLHYDINTGELWSRIQDWYFPHSNLDQLFQRLDSLYTKHFNHIMAELEIIKQNITKFLENYKNEQEIA